MTHSVLLGFHIVVGVLGVVAGPFAIAGAARGGPGWITGTYHLAVGLVCLSAIGLALLDFARLWWFVLIAVGSYLFAGLAVLAIRARHPGWQAHAVRGLGGAYIALWTAIVVVSVPAWPIVWAIPAAAGIPVIEWLATRIQRRQVAEGGLAAT